MYCGICQYFPFSLCERRQLRYQSLTLRIPPFVFGRRSRPAKNILFVGEMMTDRGTMYSKTGLLCQLVPSLEMTFVLRELFQVLGGQGRILNIDESMTYRYDQDEKSWTY